MHSRPQLSGVRTSQRNGLQADLCHGKHCERRPPPNLTTADAEVDAAVQELRAALSFSSRPDVFGCGVSCHVASLPSDTRLYVWSRTERRWPTASWWLETRDRVYSSAWMPRNVLFVNTAVMSLLEKISRLLSERSALYVIFVIK